MSPLLEGLKCTATGLAGIFTGANIYINVCEHPARMTLKDVTALRTQWKESFLRAKKMQSSICLLSSVVAGAVFYLDESEEKYIWLLGAGTLITSIPYTLAFMIKDINELCEDDVIENKGEEYVTAGIDKWNKRAMFRTLTGAASFGIFLYALSRK